MNETDIVNRLGQPSERDDDDADFIAYIYRTPEIRIKILFYKSTNKLFSYTITLMDEYINKIAGAR